MFAGIGSELRAAPITLVTDAFIARGTVHTRHRRISDILNSADNDFLVLENATLEEFGATGVAIQSDFAQVNLGAVLFGVADEPVEPTAELRVMKVSQLALVTVPPFTVTGHIHLMPGRDLRSALDELVGRFLPVTEATYWADRVGEARQTALIVAVNHSRAQILAPHREVDPWAGLDRAGEGTARTATQAEPDAAPSSPADLPWPEADRPS